VSSPLPAAPSGPGVPACPQPTPAQPGPTTPWFTEYLRPIFPERFASFDEAHAFCQRFFTWYNEEHRHSGIGLHTPSDLNPRSHFVVFHVCKYVTVVLGASRCRLLGWLVSLVNGFGTLGVSSGGCVGGSGRVRLPVGS